MTSLLPILPPLLSGIVLGGLLAWGYKALRFSRHYVPRGEHDKVQAALVEAERLLSVERERSDRGEAQLRERTLEWRRAEEERISARESLAAARAEQVPLKEHLDALRSDLEKARAENREQMDRANALQRECDTLAEQGRSQARILEAQKEEVARVQKELKSEFQVLANSLLEEKSRRFTEQNKESIEALLKPLGENIAGFKKQVEETYQKESNERFSLGKEVEKLYQLNQRLSQEANSLVNALKGNSKIQGDWGQMILENILERSGLRRGVDFSVQEFLRDADGNTLKNEDGGKMQPDAMVHFPDNRKVLIDAKVSLTAYVRLTEAGSDEERAAALAEHMRSVKRHIDELSAKNYPDFAASLDFVMMFVPSEPAYSCAMGQDPELWHYAYGKRIILINPTNLIVALKMAADLWRRENQARNHLEIAERGANLYEKFVGFVEHLKQVG
ncbi:MAG TPA: DNA recombination protein RmuC, partial [Fibrobacteria bacterium]|nr:DNA recombination protein RmuC [Fibrobacteria bacterium]